MIGTDSNCYVRIQIFTEAETKLAGNTKGEKILLAQGTLRPDLIESASSLASECADAIKTHHNDTQLVRDLRAEVGFLFVECLSKT